MKTIKTILTGTALAIAVALSAPAAAQESSYKPGTVWQVSEIKVLPGQFENYLDYLATTWKKIQEAGKAEGMVVEYHVLSLDNSRANEPDLVLVVEYKDYLTTAQQEAMQKKVNALLAQDNRGAATAAAGRTKMREPMGSQAYQELVLK
ncbi:MAG: hypothetical protein ACKOQ3_09440 [Novosphingobium sp.]